MQTVGIDHMEQDENIFGAYTREGNEWVTRGMRGLKKAEGPGEMVSPWEGEKRGFGLALSIQEFERVNQSRAL